MEGLRRNWFQWERVGAFRRRWSVWRGLYGRNGLVFKAGRLIVLVEVRFQSKGFVAPLTLKVFESRMSLHVSTKIGPVCK